jgi:uncharacterized protein (DUF302 family)
MGCNGSTAAGKKTEPLPLSVKKQLVAVPFDEAVERTIKALSTEGFGVLTRIDFDKKMKEKLDKDLPPTVILGACNPAMAYGAFCKCKDVTALLPCNAVVRVLGDDEEGKGCISVEISLAEAKMSLLGSEELVSFAHEADAKLHRVLDGI